jgi:hypothetical protein
MPEVTPMDRDGAKIPPDPPIPMDRLVAQVLGLVQDGLERQARRPSGEAYSQAVPQGCWNVQLAKPDRVADLRRATRPDQDARDRRVAQGNRGAAARSFASISLGL